MKKALIILGLTFTCSSLFAQTITGGAGITIVTGDPDDIALTDTVSTYESNICFDPTNQILYFYNPSGGADRWTGISVSSFTNSDTRLTNPVVSGGNLEFDIYNVVTASNTGAKVTVAITDIAPVQDVQGSGDISVTDNGSGTYTVSFTETNTSLTITNDTLFYTDEGGTTNKITLPSSDGSDTQVQGSGDITVTGSGTAASPYTVSFSETTSRLTITSDTLFFTDEDGTVNKITLPTSDGSDTQVQGSGDITVTGSGTSSSPYTVSFSETNTTLTITNDTLFYTDEGGAVNKVTLPTSDGSDTEVQGGGDISVTGSGTSASPYTVSFSETNTTLTITNDTLFYTDEGGTINKITLPSSDGSDTQVQGGGDISVTGSGTSASPYTVSFSETNTTLTITNDTLFYTDEGGTTNKVTLPTSDGSDTEVQGGGDISVTGSGTSASPYTVSFSETNTSLTITNDTLYFTDEAGTVNKVTLPTSDGSDTRVTGSNGVTVTGSGTSASPYNASLTGASGATTGQIPTADGSGSITWSDANISSIASDSEGKLIATFTSGATVVIDLNSAPRVDSMDDLESAADALEAGETGIAIGDDGNKLGLPAKEDSNVEIGVLFFIKKK